MEKVNEIYKKLAVVFFCLGELFFYPLYAAPIISVDYYTFQSMKEGKTRLEFYFSIDNSKLQFVSDGNDFFASVSSTLYLFNDQDELVKEQSLDYDLSCDTFDETLNPLINHYFKFNMDIDPAKYKAVLVVEDNNISTPIKHEMVLSIPDYWTTFSVSALQIFTAQEEKYKTPNINHIIFYTAPEVEVYYESYNINSDKFPQNLNIEYLLENDKGKVVQKQSQVIPVTQNNSGFNTTFPIARLASGKYSLQVNQVIGNKKASSRISFTVVQSPTNLAFKPFNQILGELQYIATSEDLDILNKLAFNERQKGIDEFWKKFDPTPETDKNEIMIEYYKRIEQAKKTFSRQKVSGLETDFGMIFMLFGKPDRVIANAQQAKVWYYRKLGLTFTFIGLNGFSAFNLVDKGQIFKEYMPR